MQVYRRWLAGLIVLWIASGLWSGALAVSEPAVETAAAVLEAGALTRLELEETPVEYVYTPSANGLYDVHLFPVSDAPRARVELWDGEDLLASGDGALKVISCRLSAGTPYTLKLSGTGAVQLEIARETLSRCFDMPLELEDGGGYSKLIAREGDVHWYSVAAQTSGAALLTCASETAGLRMQMWLFGADGRMQVSAEMLPSGSAVISAAFEAGETYYVRVAGYRGAAGKYALNARRSESTVRAESVGLSADELTIQGCATAELTPEIFPRDACDLVFLDSSAPEVAEARASGYVEGRKAGFAVITAYAYGGARSTCRVTVEDVPVQDVAFAGETAELVEGESRALIANLMPANTTRRQVSYASSDEGVVTVSASGVITGVNDGTASVTVTALDGGFSDEISVTVLPAKPRYRALLIGEQNYAATVETERAGSVRSVEGMMSLLNSASFDGSGFAVSTLMDVSRDVVLSGVRQVFADAREDDVSLVYITCHGFYQAGMTFFVMADGSVLSASDLERALRVIPGDIVLLVDCCGSGGVLGEAGSAEDMLLGVTGVFQGAVGGASVRGSKYRVIASARLDQDSYRIGFGDEESMSTVFARALCDAAGWNLDLNAPSAMNADRDYDGKITLDELDNYLSRRVMWYLNLAGDYAQSVCVYPKNDSTVIFARTSE